MPLHRYRSHPLLTRSDIPPATPHLVDVSSVFNPGATRIGAETVLLLRVQNRGRETCLVRAASADGVTFHADPGAVPIDGIGRAGRVYHAYDPRVTRLGDECLVTLALDRDDGCRLGLARSRDLRRLDFLGVITSDDSRNGVLFPEQIDGRYALLERPNRSLGGADPGSGDEIVLALSDDLLAWERVGVVARGRPHFWDERIGPGTPPMRTPAGWLLLYHGVATHFASVNIYQAGALLLDLRDPRRLLARTRYNILEPRETFELTGQVPNVVFPSGWVVANGPPAGEVGLEQQLFVYYGAADTVVGLATATVGELIADCDPVG